MKNPIRGAAVAQVRSLLDDGAAGSLADGPLLERFATRRGDPAEAAFAALVDRHGPMVLRACRSILRDPHRAQDAFQSTFLLLARRAGSLWVRDSIAPWLHSVACRVASGARAAEGRRIALERRAASRASRPADDGAGRDDLGPALHEEIERLPGRLRAPVVLCYLEGLTHDQAAEHLSCPVGTVRSRLARGRDRLRRGLVRRGFAPPSQADPTPPRIAPLPPALATLATRAARLASDRATIGPLARCLTTLSQGVLGTMTIHPLKSAAALVLAAGAIAAGLGATSGQSPKGEAERARPQARPEVAEVRPESPEARFEALSAESRSLRLRVEDLERRLEAFEPSGKARRPAGSDPRTLRKIRPRFDDALVEKIYVSAGQAVKKGDPLLEIRSAELGLARNNCRTSYVQWDHDRKYLVAREPLAKDNRITQIVWADTRNDEKKSRLTYLVSREKLATFGMTDEQIDGLLEGLSDDPKKAQEAEDKTEDVTRMTVPSPVNGFVVAVDAEAGNFYDHRDNLLMIAPTKP